jgi:IS30 family transposase
MNYTHLTTEEIIIIEAYVQQAISILNISAHISRSLQKIHNRDCVLKIRIHSAGLL